MSTTTTTHIKFDQRAEQELLLEHLGFYENNGIWSSRSPKTGWISFDGANPDDWKWCTVSELLFYVAAKCHHEGRAQGRASFRTDVLNLLGISDL